MITEAAGSAIDDGRLLAIVAGIVALDGGVRLAIAWHAHVFYLLLVPPIIAVMLGVGTLTTVWDDFSTSAVDLTDIDGQIRVLKVAAIAVAGHAFAILLGATFFFLLDTPVRAVLYWFGFDLLDSPILAIGWPLWGVGAGTLVAWTIPAALIVSIIDRRQPIQKIREVTRRPRVLGALATIHLVIAVLGGFGAGLGYYIGVKFDSISVFVGTSAVLAATLMVIPLAIAVAAHVRVYREFTGQSTRGEPETSDSDPTSLVASGPHVGLAVILVVVLVLGSLAGVARMNELRPAQPTESLQGDADEVYHTGLENTLSGSHTVTWISSPGGENESVVWHWEYDAVDRQATLDGDQFYFSTGTAAANTADSFGTGLTRPPFLREVLLTERTENGFTIQSPGTHPGLTEGITDITEFPATQRDVTWDRRETDDEIVLETTDPDEVQAVASGIDEQIRETNESCLRAVLDPDTHTLKSVEVLYNGTITGHFGTEHIHPHFRWEFETGTEVDRPHGLGEPTLVERIWATLIY